MCAQDFDINAAITEYIIGTMMYSREEGDSDHDNGKPYADGDEAVCAASE